MDKAGWEQVDQLFEEALSLPTGERDAWLVQADVPDDVRDRVRRLLASDAAAEERIGESAERLAREIVSTVDPRPTAHTDVAFPEGATIGPYRVIRELGRGGMGTVYLAERSDDQFARQVAIKVIKRGMDTDEVLQRFRQERLILARLEHPGIARMYDAGVTDDARPYLVLEFVDGVPIDRYCDTERLPVEERLRLFLSVCEAVSYAHGKLVLHRDLKPSNILVAPDGPRVLDFGIGKVLDQSEGEALTALVGRRLTPEYASPEQLAGSPTSTASDVFALGVVLHELLTGMRPSSHTSDGGPQHGPSDSPLSRPSTVLTDPSKTTGPLAAARRSTPERLARRLQGDLDVILMKALHPDTTRRYPSVEAFAADVRRHLDGFPVTARPDSWSYRAGKFVKRHRFPVFSGSGLVLSVLLFAVASSLQQLQTARERDRADRERIRAQEVAGVLEGMFTGAGFTSAERIDTLRVRDFLDLSADRIIAQLEDQPATQGSLLRILGQAQIGFGGFEEADTLLTRAIATLNAVPEQDRDPSAMARAKGELGGLRMRQGQFEEARALLGEALDDSDPDSPLGYGDALHNLGVLHSQAGAWDSAAFALDSALSIRRSDPDANAVALGSTLSMRGGVAQRMGDLPLAVRLAEEAWQVTRAALDPDHPTVLTFEQNYAFMLHRSGASTEAVPLYRDLLDRYVSTIGRTPDYATALANYGNALRGTDDLTGSLAALREADELERELLGDRSPARTFTLDALGSTLTALEQHDRALSVFNEQLSISLAAFGDQHPATAAARSKVAGTACALSAGPSSDAVTLIDEAESAIRSAFPPGHPAVTDFLIRKGRCYVRLNRGAEARESLAEALQALERGGPAERAEEVRQLLAALDD